VYTEKEYHTRILKYLIENSGAEVRGGGYSYLRSFPFYHIPGKKGVAVCNVHVYHPLWIGVNKTFGLDENESARLIKRWKKYYYC
jgi:hypothetical protein